MNQDSNHQNRMIFLLSAVLGVGILWRFYDGLSNLGQIFFLFAVPAVVFPCLTYWWDNYSVWGREKRKYLEAIKEIPAKLVQPDSNSIYMGAETNLEIPIYLPDSIRSRHVHILGATGSGKTESVILNFLRQDVERGLGTIILDAKGDMSFLESLHKWVPEDKLKVFDLCDEKSLPYNPLGAGTPLEAAQRLFSSLTWSEEFYASKSRSVLQIIFQRHFSLKNKNPTLKDVAVYLETPKSYAAFAVSPTYPAKLAVEDYMGITGLRDQVNMLCTGHLGSILSPIEGAEIDLSKASEGSVIYFRLQSLMSPQIAATTGKLLINHLNFLAGTAHRGTKLANKAKLVPIYLDEFATFACLEFADLISKARSAGFALHFSHQSIGDVEEVSKGFINRITDNAGTKIIMRIYDPDSAEFFARSFGSSIYQKVTQRITNVKEVDAAEVTGEGSSREAHKFRASPDLLKTLPTGMGAVLVAHGEDMPSGASSVFKIRFPPLLDNKNQTQGGQNE